MFMAFIVWSVLAVFFVVLGIVTLNSKKAVGFWANVKVPEIADVKAYNKALSVLWFVFAVVFELLGLPLLLGNDAATVVISFIGTFFLILVTMGRYMVIENKYRKK